MSAPVLADEPINCVALHCRLPARDCVARQLKNERRQRADPRRDAELARHDGKKGSHAAGCFPHCTERCAQGAAVRAAIGDLKPRGRRFAGADLVTW